MPSETAAPVADRGIDPNQSFASVFVTPPDGPMLHVRSYGPRFAAALPVVCLPGLARTAADFHPLAAALAADPATPRHVLALDYRGHGKSKYDRYPSNYTPFVALADLLAVLTEVQDRIGYFHWHVLWRPTCLDARCIAAGGHRRCRPQRHRSRHRAGGLAKAQAADRGSWGKDPDPRNFEEGAEIMRWLLHKDFPKLAPQDWIAFARRTWRERGDRLVPDFDPKVARMLQRHLEHPPAMWSEFDALARVPLMVIRGSNSDLLASTTLNAMLARRGELTVAVVPDQGHAPLLVEPKLIRRIATFVASCDLPARG